MNSTTIREPFLTAADVVTTTPTTVNIAVCGEPSAGKSVFITCAFQTIAHVVDEQLIVEVDRERGRQQYFKEIEQQIIDTGTIEGTAMTELFAARFEIRPYTPPGEARAPGISVELKDSAGGHFGFLTDLHEPIPDADQQRTFDEIRRFIEEADAIIVMVNARDIDPVRPRLRRNPFSQSVLFLRDLCREQRKPLALLFSQIDQVPALTADEFGKMPRVQEFRRIFTADLAEFGSGRRPFGIVDTLSCYETDDGVHPRRQGTDSIWSLEPARIVTTLLRAAVPAARRAVEVQAGTAIDEAAEREAQEARRRRLRRYAIVAGGVLLLLLVVVLAVGAYRQGEGRQVQVIEAATTALNGGNLRRLEPATLTQLLDVLASRGVERTQTDRVGTALVALDGAIGGAVRRLVEQPSLDAAYAEEIDRVAEVAPRTGSASAWTLRASRLDARRRFVAALPALESALFAQRRQALTDQALSFQQRGDREFAAALRTRATLDKQQEVAGWAARVNASADVQSRAATIQELLTHALAMNDAELSAIARTAAVTLLAGSILERQENPFVRAKLLAPLAPDLAKVIDGQIRIDVLADRLVACPDIDECAGRHQTAIRVLDEAELETRNRSASAENLLKTALFDAPRRERAALVAAIGGAIERTYLFSLRADAWPAGLLPLSAQIAPRAAADDLGWLIERVARTTVYRDELEYLVDRTAVATARRRLVQVYAQMRTWLSDGTVQPIDSATAALLDNLSNDDGPQRGSAVAGLRAEVSRLAELVRPIVEQSRRGAADAARVRQLGQFLDTALRRHCGALDPRPQTGCDDGTP